MNTAVPSRSSGNASLVTVAIVGLAGAVAGSLAVWTALASGPNAAPEEQTCHCECVTEAQAPAAEAPTAEAEPQAVASATEEEPASGPPVPRIRQAEHKVVGPMDRDIIRRIVRAHINEVRYCYNEGLKHDPELSGRVSVQFTLSPSGSVAEAVVASSTLGDEEEDGVASCMTKAVERWKFPKFDGDPTVVTYPFVLSPGD